MATHETIGFPRSFAWFRVAPGDCVCGCGSAPAGSLCRLCWAATWRRPSACWPRPDTTSTGDRTSRAAPPPAESRDRTEARSQKRLISAVWSGKRLQRKAGKGESKSHLAELKFYSSDVSFQRSYLLRKQRDDSVYFGNQVANLLMSHKELPFPDRTGRPWDRKIKDV